MKFVSSSGADTKVSFYSRKNNTRSVFVEGFANRFQEGEKLLIDRGNDLIDPKGWKLENFQSNGIILFNHDRDNPVGRAVKIEVNDDGLFVKAKMSDSEHPEVSRIRDLVKDGVLRAFSVGFDPKKSSEEDIGGAKVNMIKEAELLEISIVSLPMAERSLFNVSAKALSDLPYHVAKQACLGELNIYEDDGETQTTQLVEIVNKFKKAEETPPTEATEDSPPSNEAAEIIDSQPKEAPTSPLLDQVKQTNILLSNLISETKLMSMKLDKAEVEKVEDEEPEDSDPEPKPIDEEEEDEEGKEKPPAEDEEEEEEKSKKLKLVDDIHAHCDKVLRGLGA